MKLPDVEKAEIREAKVVNYLLSTTHPSGKSKAAFFMEFGFSADKWEELAAALKQHAMDNEVARTENTAFGTRYIVEGRLKAPDGTWLKYPLCMVYSPGRRSTQLCHGAPIEKETRMIGELESVILTRDLPAHGLKQGDIGTVVLVHDGGKGYEVEFTTLDGETIAVVTLKADEVRPSKPKEIAHARGLAANP